MQARQASLALGIPGDLALSFAACALATLLAALVLAALLAALALGLGQHALRIAQDL